MIQVENEMKFVTETPNEIKSSMGAAAKMICNGIMQIEIEHGICDCKWKLK